jgi:opacity protein-like surface antigen
MNSLVRSLVARLVSGATAGALCGSVLLGAAHAAEPPAAADEKQGSTAFIFKAGGFRLSDTEQPVGGANSRYDEDSSGVIGGELEYRFANGFALGAELFHYKNDLTRIGTTQTAKQNVLAYMFNGKAYFGLGDTVYPYVGAGIGSTAVAYSGDLDGSASGFAAQLMAGVELRFGKVGLYTELKGFGSTATDSEDRDVKIGGSAAFVGLSVSF